MKRISIRAGYSGDGSGAPTCQKDQPGAETGEFCYAPAECGNGNCEPGETPEGCPEDCGYCGDGVCVGDEPSYCTDDC